MQNSLPSANGPSPKLFPVFAPSSSRTPGFLPRWKICNAKKKRERKCKLFSEQNQVEQKGGEGKEILQKKIAYFVEKKLQKF